MRVLIVANFFPGHFAGINFRALGFTEDFAGINFRELSLTKDFAGINFRECALYKDLQGGKFCVFTKEYLFDDISLWFLEHSVKNNTFLLKE